MTEDGTSVIFITHKLNEVIAVSDRVTIFRKGKVVGTLNTADTDKMELAVLMVGRGVHFEVDKKTAQPGATVLQIKDLVVTNKSGRPILKDLSLEVLSNEILGIAGVGGNGQMELFDTIVGVKPSRSGSIILGAENITRFAPMRIAERGVASIPADRLVQGLLLEFSVAENLVLGSQRNKKYRKNTLMNERLIRNNAEELIKEYDVATTGPKQIAGRLSGGNLQKLILARELSREVKFVIANCPTRGLDVGAIEYVHQRLVGIRDQGKGVLLISDDLDEIFNLADRIAVIFQGEIMRVFKHGEITREQVGLLMAGVREGIQ
jgi:simple sugar transport system ATP-binding protein